MNISLRCSTHPFTQRSPLPSTRPRAHRPIGAERLESRHRSQRAQSFRGDGYRPTVLPGGASRRGHTFPRTPLRLAETTEKAVFIGV